ncbi:MAG: hypothetical protein RIG77_24455 [Cyclobacteriaceae bacterium]
MRLLSTCFLVIIVSFRLEAQTIKSDIDGTDFWGAWLVEGTSTAWLVDEIPERARLWDYKTNQVIASFDLKENVKNVNLLDGGSLAYISHHDKNEYIVLGADGNVTVQKFKSNAPGYYIHPNGKHFFGSVFEGFVTYTLEEKKISSSKLNETITGYSGGFVETNSPDIIFRYAEDIVQKIDIGPEGTLIPSRAFDKSVLLLNSAKDQFLMVSPSTFKYYSLPNGELQSTVNRTQQFSFTDAVYDSESNVMFYSTGNQIHTFDLKTQKISKSTTVDAIDLHFADRIGNTVIAFSDVSGKFCLIEL